MVFSSHLFMFYFLPLVLLVYYSMPKRARHLVLTVLSYVFYGWANPWFIVLMWFQTVVDYVAGILIAGPFGPPNEPVRLLEKGTPRTAKQKAALAIAVCSNLALLGFFKYFNFGVDNYNAIVASLGWPQAHWDILFRVTLPLGISFYTFQSMSYTIDVYRGDARAVRNLIDYACYVSMYPQLVAGPIVRFQDVADQLQYRSHTAVKFGRGVAFVALGLAKKILLANPCGKIADTAFNAGSVGWSDSWYGVSAYAFQIYFDFSAYSDMAIGLGLMLGFVFAKNFDSPYWSESITEFWRRWHLSLSTWLRDNLYFPLGGNRKGEIRTYANVAIVMLLGGLWHGASWNFLIWGGIQGFMLALERLHRKTSFYNWMPRPGKIAMTFLVVLFAWVFFRAEDLPRAIQYCGSMLGLGQPQDGAALISGLLYQPYYVGTFLMAAVVTWGFPQTWDWTRTITWPKVAVIVLLLWLSLVVLTTQAYNPFIYFFF